MNVQIITTRHAWTYTIAVKVDGQMRETLTAQHYEVIRRRNQLCERWSETAARVTANAIPQIPELRREHGR
jgi:hypothetical protein